MDFYRKPGTLGFLLGSRVCTCRDMHAPEHTHIQCKISVGGLGGLDRSPARVWATFRLDPSGLGRFSTLIPRVRTTFRPGPFPRPPTGAPRVAQDRPQRPRERPKTAHRGPRSPPKIALPLGSGPLFGLIPHKTAHRGPKTAQDRPHRPQERLKTAHIGPKSGLRAHAEAPRQPKITHRGPRSLPKGAHRGPKTVQDHPHRPQELPKTAHRGPKSRPRPPTEAPRAAKDRPRRPKRGLRPPTEAHQLHERPSIENVKEKIKDDTRCLSTAQSFTKGLYHLHCRFKATGSR